MKRQLFLHAGKHKTGSTSIQRYLADNDSFFMSEGLKVVTHSLGPSSSGIPSTNCVDIAHSVIRPDLDTPYRLARNRGHPTEPAEQRRDALEFGRILANTEGDALVVSAEAFSFLRTPAEQEVFRLVFAEFEVTSLVFFRNPSDWMESWIRQTSTLFANFGHRRRSVTSIFDYGPDSWLVDDRAIEAFFPECRPLSYEDAIDGNGSVLPVFLEALGLRPQECPPWDAYERGLRS